MLIPLIATCFLAPPSPSPSATDDEPPPAQPIRSISAGARVAVRPESRANTSFGASPSDERWRILQAARLDVAGRYGPLSIVVQLQDVREWGQSTSTASDAAFTGAHQGYVELAGNASTKLGPASAFVRVGRQEVRLWTGRLLAESPWVIGKRAFDGVRGRFDVGRFGAELGGIAIRMPRELDTGTPGPTLRTQGQQVAWAEFTGRIHPAFEAHAAVFVMHEGATETDLERDRLHLTPGVYVHGEPLEGLRYDVEAYGQLGRNGSLDHRAWAGQATIDYTASVALKPGVRVSYEVTSGSACTNAPATGQGCAETVERDFMGFFGVRHAYRGFADLVGPTNIRDLHGRASLNPAQGTTFSVDYHWLGLQETRGQWTSTSGALVGSGWSPTNEDNTLGHELDLLVSYKPWDALHVRPGYTLFIPTAAGRTLGGTQPLHFAYVWLIAKLGHTWAL